jgi:hypothetical protein
MASIKGRGSVVFIEKEKTSDVTYMSRYEVTYRIEVESTDELNPFFHEFYLKYYFQSDKDEGAYREIETQSARKLAPMLRLIASQIESQVADFDARESAPSS